MCVSACMALGQSDAPDRLMTNSGGMQVVQEQSLEDPLYVVDLGALSRLYQAWVKLMPRVTPYYAVKCNTGRAAYPLPSLEG